MSDKLKNDSQKSASEWNGLLGWARKERGAYMDIMTRTYQVDRNQLFPYGTKVFIKEKISQRHNIAYLHQPKLHEEFEEFKDQLAQAQSQALAAQAEMGINPGSDNETSFNDLPFKQLQMNRTMKSTNDRFASTNNSNGALASPNSGRFSGNNSSYNSRRGRPKRNAQDF